jgi:hypothetical protein
MSATSSYGPTRVPSVSTGFLASLGISPAGSCSAHARKTAQPRSGRSDCPVALLRCPLDLNCTACSSHINSPSVIEQWCHPEPFDSAQGKLREGSGRGLVDLGFPPPRFLVAPLLGMTSSMANWYQWAVSGVLRQSRRGTASPPRHGRPTGTRPLRRNGKQPAPPWQGHA